MLQICFRIIAAAVFRVNAIGRKRKAHLPCARLPLPHYLAACPAGQFEHSRVGWSLWRNTLPCIHDSLSRKVIFDRDSASYGYLPGDCVACSCVPGPGRVKMPHHFFMLGVAACCKLWFKPQGTGTSLSGMSVSSFLACRRVEMVHSCRLSSRHDRDFVWRSRPQALCRLTGVKSLRTGERL